MRQCHMKQVALLLAVLSQTVCLGYPAGVAEAGGGSGPRAAATARRKAVQRERSRRPPPLLPVARLGAVKEAEAASKADAAKVTVDDAAPTHTDYVSLAPTALTPLERAGRRRALRAAKRGTNPSMGANDDDRLVQRRLKNKNKNKYEKKKKKLKHRSTPSPTPKPKLTFQHTHYVVRSVNGSKVSSRDFFSFFSFFFSPSSPSNQEKGRRWVVGLRGVGGRGILGDVDGRERVQQSCHAVYILC